MHLLKGMRRNPLQIRLTWVLVANLVRSPHYVTFRECRTLISAGVFDVVVTLVSVGLVRLSRKGIEALG